MTKKIQKIVSFMTLSALVILSTVASAERIRLDRKHGEVNGAFQKILSTQISKFPNGVGKIELGRSGEKSDCAVDLFVSPETAFTVFSSKKEKIYSEFYVDHPHASFKDVLFQALVIQGEQSTLSVDRKDGGYKFIFNGKTLGVEVRDGAKSAQCDFDIAKAIFTPDETE